MRTRRALILAILAAALAPPAMADRLIRRPLSDGGNVTLDEWVDDMKVRCRLVYDGFMNDLIYPLRDPKFHKDMARAKARQYLYQRAAWELVTQPRWLLDRMVADVNAYILSLDYLPTDADENE